MPAFNPIRDDYRSLGDLTGKTFGLLYVLGYHGRNNKYAHLWICQCQCGDVCIKEGSSLAGRGHRVRRVTACPKCAAKRCGIGKRKPYDTNSRLYSIWRQIRRRCFNRNDKLYLYYGGRGITVCQEWQESFVPFRDWALANGYRDDLTIDRIDNNGNYEPGNCRWTTQQQQVWNQRTNNIVEAFGESKCVGEWAQDPRCKPSYFTLMARIKKGWSPEESITKPVRPMAKPKR